MHQSPSGVVPHARHYQSGYSFNGPEVTRLREGDNITWMELWPIILASAAWGPAWQGQRIIMHCDNTGAVTGANSGGGLGIRLLDSTVQELFTASLAPATLKVYRTGTK